MLRGHERVQKVRSLNDAEKVALICNQEYRLHAYQQRVEALTCAHEEGTCVLCRDKDQTIEDLQKTVKDLKTRLYGRSSERRKKVKRPKAASSSGEDKPEKNRAVSGCRRNSTLRLVLRFRRLLQPVAQIVRIAKTR
jgi:hypothetical protein